MEINAKKNQMKKALIGFGGHAREVMSQMGKKFLIWREIVPKKLAIANFNVHFKVVKHKTL